MPEDNMERKQPVPFKRQLALLEEVKVLQNTCEHTLIGPIGNGIIVCTECSAIWIK